MSKQIKIPKHWEVLSIKDAFDIIREKGFENDVPYLEIGDVDLNKKNYLLKGKPSVKGCKVSKKGDILISRVRPTRGAITQIKEELISVSSAFTIIRDKGIFALPFPFYFLAWNKAFLKYLGDNCTGSLYPTVSEILLSGYKMPIPPIKEQQAIVIKIEELFSYLENGIQHLQTAQQQLNIYRQSLLKFTFEGKLTNKNVKIGVLPKGWKWVKIDSLLSDKKRGMVTGPFGTMLKKNEHQKNGIPVLGIENIGEGVFQMPNKIFITKEKAIELKNYRVKENDIIISRSGTVGEICLIPKKMENSIISTNLIKVSLNHEVINPKFFVYLFQGGKVRQMVFELCKGSSRAFLNQTIINSLVFPVCSLEEQQRIINELESRLTVYENIKETIIQSLQLTEILRYSILKKAFEGNLVPTNLYVEPAKKILERIRKGREEFLAEQKRIKKIPRTKKSLNMKEELKTLIQILQESKIPVYSKTLWQSSVYKDDIDAFYAQLKKHIDQGEIEEIERQGKESFLKLVQKNENR